MPSLDLGAQVTPEQMLLLVRTLSALHLHVGGTLPHAACTKFPRGRVAVFIREYLETPFDRDRVVGQDHDVHIVAGDPTDWSITVREIRRLVESQRYAMLLLEVVDPTEAYAIAREELAAIGLHLNREKCEAWKEQTDG